MRNHYLSAVAAGLVIAALAWIDPLFIPLVLAGPPVTGALAATRGVGWHPVALAWAIGGIGMLVSDELVNHEDAVFHAALTVVMVLLACAGWGVVRLVRRRATA
jgi:hypothetical protein